MHGCAAQEAASTARWFSNTITYAAWFMFEAVHAQKLPTLSKISGHILHEPLPGKPPALTATKNTFFIFGRHILYEIPRNSLTATLASRRCFAKRSAPSVQDPVT